MPVFSHLPRWLWNSTSHPAKPFGHSFLISWSGMRGAVSLAAADVHLISLKEPVLGIMVPSKLFGIMAAGRPGISRS